MWGLEYKVTQNAGIRGPIMAIIEICMNMKCDLSNKFSFDLTCFPLNNKLFDAFLTVGVKTREELR